MSPLFKIYNAELKFAGESYRKLVTETLANPRLSKGDRKVAAGSMKAAYRLKLLEKYRADGSPST